MTTNVTSPALYALGNGDDAGIFCRHHRVAGLDRDHPVAPVARMLLRSAGSGGWRDEIQGAHSASRQRKINRTAERKNDTG